MVMNSVKQIKMMIKHLYHLNKNYNTEEADVVNIINIVVISNSLHTPDLAGVENIPKEFIRENAEKLYEYLKSYVGGKYSKFFTAEEIAVFINEKREEYKIKKLKDNQDLDIEENEIRRQMKVAGIMVVKEVDVADGEAKADDADAEGNINDAYKGEEKDDDYNSKDNENYNIYNDADEDMD
jgi:ribosome-associated protein YbcJ (S4-like RNA binding protein)